MKLLRKLNNKGFTHMEVALVIAVMVAIGGTYVAIRGSHALAVPVVEGGGRTGYNYKAEPAVTLGHENVKFSTNACLGTGYVHGQISVARLAGKTTLRYLNQHILLRSGGQDTPILINKGYNPIAIYKVGNKVYTDDNWHIINKNLSVDNFSFANTNSTDKISLGIRGIVDNRAVTNLNTPFTYASLTHC